MMLTPKQAQEMLTEIEQTQERSRQYIGYWRAGVFVQLWGVVWFVAYLGCYLVPDYANWIWLAGDASGIAGSIILGMRQPSRDRDETRKFITAFIIVMLFGLLAASLIRRAEAVALFWNCLFMTLYMLIGVWEGRRWLLLGATVFLLSMLSYWMLLPWFNLAMAVLGGGGLMLGGTWMRRAA